MTNEIEQLQEQLFAIATREMDAGNHEKAIEVAIGCHFLSKGYGPELETMATTQIFAAFTAYLKPGIDNFEAKCSFCGKGDETVRLGAGPEAYICEECVNIFAEHFKSEPK